MSNENKIDYLEIPCSNLEGTQKFFQTVFGWEFESFSEDYIVFTNGGMNGGFYRSTLNFTQPAGSPLIVFYREDLDAALAAIESAGGTITHPVFTFPGGSRFHFTDPSGNEYACWSDRGAGE